MTVHKATPDIHVEEINWIFRYDPNGVPYFVTRDIPVVFTLPAGVELESVNLVESTPLGWGMLFQACCGQDGLYWVKMIEPGEGVIEVTTKENDYFHGGVGRARISGRDDIRRTMPPPPVQ